jgi:hypothetical protein
LCEDSLLYLSDGVFKHYNQENKNGVITYRGKDDECFSDKLALGNGIKLNGNVLVFEHYVLLKIIEFGLERKFAVTCVFKTV